MTEVGYYLYEYGCAPFVTMTPSGVGFFTSNENEATLYHYNHHGFSGNYSVAHSYAISPAINLKADIKFTGAGSIESPYEIVTE